MAQGLYVFGGAGAAGELTDLLFYDPQAEHWRELRPSGRPPRPGRGAAWHGEGLVVLGGDALHFYDAQATRFRVLGAVAEANLWTELSGAPWQALWAANGLCVFGAGPWIALWAVGEVASAARLGSAVLLVSCVVGDGRAVAGTGGTGRRRN